MKKKWVLSGIALLASLALPIMSSGPAFAAFQSQTPTNLQSTLLATIPVNDSVSPPGFVQNEQQMIQGADGTTYAIAGNKVVVVSPEGKLINTWGVNNPVDIAISPDNTTLYVGVSSPTDSGNQLNVLFINTESGAVEETLLTKAYAGTGDILYPSSDGDSLYIADNNTLWQYSTQTGKLLNTISYNGYFVGVSDDGTSVYSIDAVNYSSTDTSKLVQNDLTLGGQVSYNLPVPSSNLFGMNYMMANIPSRSPNIYIVNNGAVELFSTATDQSTTLITPDNQIESQSTQVSYATGNYFLLSNGSHGSDASYTISIFDMSKGSLVGTITNTSFDNINQFSMQGNTLAVYTTNGLYIYQLSGLNDSNQNNNTQSGNTGFSNQTGDNNGNGTTGDNGNSGDNGGTTNNGNNGNGNSTTNTGNAISLQAGWNLVDASVAQAANVKTMYFWDGTAYQTSSNNNGDGVWIYEKSAQTVTMPNDNSTYYSVNANAKQWTMIGNPFSSTETVTLQTGDQAFVYSPSSGYSSAETGTLTLQPGQAAWLYSMNGGSYSIGSLPPTPPTVTSSVY